MESTKGQRQKIKILQRQIGIDDDTYRGMLFDRFKKTSSTDLTFHQAGFFLNELTKKAGGKVTFRAKRGNRVPRQGAGARGRKRWCSPSPSIASLPSSPR